MRGPGERDKPDGDVRFGGFEGQGFERLVEGIGRSGKRVGLRLELRGKI